jgi:hypothetical protein
LAKERKAGYEDLFERWGDIMMTLRKRNDFTDGEIEELQRRKIDPFARLYMRMFGGNNITNYLHDLFAGHVTHFLYRYRNLYRYSNIGFECYVGVVRSFVLRRTPKGGGRQVKLAAGGLKTVVTSAKSVRGFALRQMLNLQTDLMSSGEDKVAVRLAIITAGRDIINSKRRDKRNAVAVTMQSSSHLDRLVSNTTSFSVTSSIRDVDMSESDEEPDYNYLVAGFKRNRNQFEESM